MSSYPAPMDLLYPRYLWVNRTTHSDVMSTATTTSIYASSSKPVKEDRLSRKISLPKFNGGSLEPLIQIPAAKRNKALLKEREEFMERLARERRERAELERWAATTIQALARGFLGRPAHPERNDVKQIKDSNSTQAAKENIFVESKLDPETLREQLARITAETNFYMDLISDNTQNSWRKHVSKKAEGKQRRRQRKMIEKNAAKKMQSVARGFLGRRAYATLARRKLEEEKRWAAVKIQVIVRGFLARMYVLKRVLRKRTRAATTIQRRVRGWFGRTYAKVYKIRLSNIQIEDDAAMKIQNLMRANMERKIQDRIEKEAAALKIQAIARGRKGRAEFNRKQQQIEQDLREKEEAAIKMQNVMRGRMARKQVNRKREIRQRQHEQAAALKIQSVQRGKKGRQRYRMKVQQKRESNAALAIQQKARSRMAKAKVNKARKARDENNAALKIQSIQRGKMGRRRFSQKKQEQDMLSMESEVLEQSRRDARNAELAQEAAERRALEEMEQKAAEEAATAKIQAAARGRSGRKKAERRRKALEEKKQREAAIRIQKLQRGKAARTRMEAQRRSRNQILEQQQADDRTRVRRRKKAGDEDDSDEDDDDENVVEN